MNEKIKKLVLECNFTEEDIKELSPGLEKCIELVINECINLLPEECPDTDGVHMCYKFKEHFGVKND